MRMWLTAKCVFQRQIKPTSWWDSHFKIYSISSESQRHRTGHREKENRSGQKKQNPTWISMSVISNSTFRFMASGWEWMKCFFTKPTQALVKGNVLMRRITLANTKQLGVQGGANGRIYHSIRRSRTSVTLASHLQSPTAGGMERGLPPHEQDTERAAAGAGGSLSGPGWRVSLFPAKRARCLGRD